MARERMVTRTVNLAIAEVMCLDTETANVSLIDYEIGGGLADPETILKVVKKQYETNTHKCVAINNLRFTETLYGMPESDFIKLAKVLPARAKESNNENT